MEYKTVSILVLPTDEAAEETADKLFSQAERRAGRRELKRAEDSAILDAVYAPKK